MDPYGLSSMISHMAIHSIQSTSAYKFLGMTSCSPLSMT